MQPDTGRRRIVGDHHVPVADPQLPDPPALDFVGMPRHPHRHRLYNRACERTRDLQTTDAGERARPLVRARHARARGAARPPRADGARADLDSDGDRRQGGRDEGDDPGGHAAPQGARPRRRREGRPGARADGDRRRARSACRLVAAALGGASLGLPPRRRAPRRPVALDARRRDDAQPVEDRAPGRDRCRRRADRLLALQRRVHAPDLLGAAGLVAGRLEPDGVPAARRLRLRGQPVQLHRDRRQPQRLARADGEHRRLEAGLERRALRSLHPAAAAGGRAPGWGDQPRLRLGRDDRRRCPREPRARRHPLHRLDSGLSEHVEDGGRRTSRATGTTRASSARPAARTSSSPTRAPTSTRSRRRSSAAPSSTRDRSAPPPHASSHRRACGLR